MSTLLAAAPKGELLPATTRHFLANGQFGKPQKQYRRQYDHFGAGQSVSSLRIEGMPVFRSGTFRDSWGEQTEWTSMHTNQMIQHFSFLKDNDIFSDVPVRKGHPSILGEPMDSLIGYITNMSVQDMTSPVDGQKYSYVLADYDIIDPEAIAKIESGLWRNRSAEIGTFVTNSEASYTPTFMGFAYVDIPAVEGLNGAFSKTNPDFAIARGPKGQHMATKKNADGTDAPDDATTGPAAPTVPPVADPPPVQPDNGPDSDPDDVEPSTLDPENPPATQAPVGAEGSREVPAVVTPIAGGNEQTDPENVTEPVVGPIGITVDDPAEEPEVAAVVDPLPVTEQTQGPIFAKWNGNHFTIGGRKSSPEAAVALLNQFQASNVAAFNKEKKDRITALAKSGVIMAPSIDATLKYAASLGRAQFDEWIALEEAKPPLPLFARQSSPTQADVNNVKTAQFQVHKEVVAQLRLTKSEKIVKDSGAWKKGLALASELNLPWE